MTKKTKAAAPVEERVTAPAQLWSDEGSLQTIVKNLQGSMLIIPHGLNRDLPAIVLGPGEEKFLTDIEEWKRSANFRRAVEGTESEPPKVRVFLAKAPRNRPPLPPEMNRNLSAQQLHTVDQILMLPLERALEIVNVRPRGGDLDTDTGLSEVARSWLLHSHLRVLQAALWFEERWEKRPALLAALRRRIGEIQDLPPSS